MPIYINNPILSTSIFIVIFVFVLLISIRRKEKHELFSLELTRELKGLAILAIIFSHVGYFLSDNHNFLFPLSIMAGVGVNLFLFLSGYGLTISSLKEKLQISEFYEKRLLRLFVPFWIILIIFFLLDFFLLHISYSSTYILKTLFGFFGSADLFTDIDSPLWFFTQILFYYLVFPLLFLRKHSWFTAILVYISSYFILQLNLPVTESVFHLYQLHMLAFPLGVAVASLFSKSSVWLPIILNKIKKLNIFWNNLRIMKHVIYYGVLTALLILVGYTAYYSGVGESLWKEQLISLVTMSAVIFLFSLKKFEIKAFSLFGLYAYEVYLLHWPLVSRYDFFFKFFPGWLAMVLHLILILFLAWLLVKIQNRIHQIKMPHKILESERGI
ncbi:MAG: acyltransferase family protein [Candidatus Paceibacterota bacterium]|jgi:peptidoglycan/LPS O-acetylase OafA/YrhL